MRMIQTQNFDGMTTVVPVGAKLDGAMTASQSLALRIDGEFKGSIEIGSGGAVHIGPDAVIEAKSLVADHIYVEGKVKGNLHARKGLEVASSARIRGEVRYDGEMDVHPGAKLSGTVSGPEDLAELDEKP